MLVQVKSNSRVASALKSLVRFGQAFVAVGKLARSIVGPSDNPYFHKVSCL